MNIMKIYMRSIWKLNLVYKWYFIISLFVDFFNIFSMLFIWYIVYKYNQNTSIKGFNFNSILLYTIFSTINSKFYDSEAEYTIAGEIDSGQIINNFIRPISYFKRLIAESLGDFSFELLFYIFPILIIFISYTFYYNLNFNITYISILFYIITLIFSIIINFLLSFLTGLMAFYVNYIWGFMTFKSTLLTLITGQLFPLIFLPTILVDILKFTPFYYMNFAPISILLNQIKNNEIYKIILIQFCWCILLSLIVYFVWSSAKKYLSINGG